MSDVRTLTLTRPKDGSPVTVVFNEAAGVVVEDQEITVAVKYDAIEAMKAELSAHAKSLSMEEAVILHCPVNYPWGSGGTYSVFLEDTTKPKNHIDRLVASLASLYNDASHKGSRIVLPPAISVGLETAKKLDLRTLPPRYVLAFQGQAEVVEAIRSGATSLHDPGLVGRVVDRHTEQFVAALKTEAVKSLDQLAQKRNQAAVPVPA